MRRALLIGILCLGFVRSAWAGSCAIVQYATAGCQSANASCTGSGTPWTFCTGSGTGTGTTNACLSSGNYIVNLTTTAGNMMVASFTSAATTSLISGGGTWVQDKSVNNANSGLHSYEYHACNVTSGAKSVTMNGGFGNSAGAIVEVSGAISGCAIDVAPTGTTSASNQGSLTGPSSGVLAQSNELLVDEAGGGAQSSNSITAASNGFTSAGIISGSNTGASSVWQAMAYLVDTNTSSVGTTISVSSGLTYGSTLVGYECAASPGTLYPGNSTLQGSSLFN